MVACRLVAHSLTSEDPGAKPTCSHAVRARCNCTSLGETAPQDARMTLTAKTETIRIINSTLMVAPSPGRACAPCRQARPCSLQNARCRDPVAWCRRKYGAIAPAFPVQDRCLATEMPRRKKAADSPRAQAPASRGSDMSLCWHIESWRALVPTFRCGGWLWYDTAVSPCQTGDTSIS